jgi:hypothetical protein
MLIVAGIRYNLEVECEARPTEQRHTGHTNFTASFNSANTRAPSD